MANHPVKYNVNKNKADTLRNNWEVMKPFVHFAVKAMGLVISATIGIIKLMPALLEHKNNTPKKDTRIIKI